jgi:hypothetical protein
LREQYAISAHPNNLDTVHKGTLSEDRNTLFLITTTENSKKSKASFKQERKHKGQLGHSTPYCREKVR